MDQVGQLDLVGFDDQPGLLPGFPDEATGRFFSLTVPCQGVPLASRVRRDGVTQSEEDPSVVVL